MAAFAKTDLTVAITRKDIAGRQKIMEGTLTFGDGSLTYPTAGIPLPDIGDFGFVRNMDSLEFYGNNARTLDYMTRYNKAAHKLLMYEEEATAAGGPLLECDTSEAPAAITYNFIAKGW